MTFAELKFSIEKCREGEFAIGQNAVNVVLL